MDSKWTDAGKVLNLKVDILALGLNNVSSGAPSSPQEGEPWYDSTNHFIRWYDGSGWNAICVYIGTSAPGTPVEGLAWYDTTNNVLKSYDGAAWHTKVTLDDIQVLTNKTLTSPKINEDVVLTSTSTEIDAAVAATGVFTAESVIDGKLITENFATPPIGRLGFGSTGLNMYSPSAPIQTEIFQVYSNMKKTGSQTSSAANKLIDSGGGFSGLVAIGDYAINITDNTDTTVTAIDSDTQLSLADDIFDGTEVYEIFSSVTGDITIGSAGAMLNYDYSEGTLTFNGILEAGIVDQAALKTDTEEETADVAPGEELLTFSSVGEYGFYPQVKFEADTPTAAAQIYSDTGDGPESYVTTIAVSHQHGSLSRNCYAQIRYVTASGEICWVFILQDKITGKYTRMHKCPDHPAIGCHDVEAVHHPFYKAYNPKKHNMFVIPLTKAERAEVEDMREWKNELPGLTFLETVKKYYDIDENPKG
ncbi:unnamed protein product, partial [marine sediment metagenome]